MQFWYRGARTPSTGLRDVQPARAAGVRLWSTPARPGSSAARPPGIRVRGRLKVALGKARFHLASGTLPGVLRVLGV